MTILKEKNTYNSGAAIAVKIKTASQSHCFVTIKNILMSRPKDVSASAVTKESGWKSRN